MSQAAESSSESRNLADGLSSAQQIQQALSGKNVCPFCGGVSETSDGVCARCTMENSPLTRQATKARLGPWYVLQSRNPSAPGMKYSVLLALVKKGQITPRSIVRGPTTNQFWRFAARVRGLSREFGICWGCSQEIDTGAAICPYCQRNQEPPPQPDELLDGRRSISQMLPVQREIRPGAEPEAIMSSSVPVTTYGPSAGSPTVSPARPAMRMTSATRDTTLEELAAMEAAQQRLALQGRRLPSPQPVLPQYDAKGRAVAPYPNAEPQHTLGKVLVLLGLMAVFTVSGWLYIDASSREKLFTWAQDTWRDLSSTGKPAPSNSLSGEQDRRVAGEKIVIESPQTHAAPIASEAAVLPQDKPAIAPQARVVPVPDDAPSVAPAPEPVSAASSPQNVPPASVVPSASAVSENKPPQVEIAVGSNQPAASQGRIEVRTATASTSSNNQIPQVTTTDPDELVNISRQLWRQAIDAEVKGDWKEAVKLYERIKSMPAIAWPSGLNIRLDDAQRRAQQ